MVPSLVHVFNAMDSSLLPQVCGGFAWIFWLTNSTGLCRWFPPPHYMAWGHESCHVQTAQGIVGALVAMLMREFGEPSWALIWRILLQYSWSISVKVASAHATSCCWNLAHLGLAHTFEHWQEILSNATFRLSQECTTCVPRLLRNVTFDTLKLRNTPSLESRWNQIFKFSRDLYYYDS